ncbi:MAG: flavin reductase family protein [Candidatus Bathyarchaeia archaeon]
MYPRNVVLVSCADEVGKTNIITLAWSMPVSMKPPMAAIGVAPKRHSHLIIKETREFVINIPTMKIVRESLLCGRITGARYDKFEEARFTPISAKTVRPPLIKECVAHLECRLRQQLTTGDHTIFIGDVLAAHANEGIFDKRFKVEAYKPVFHMGGDNFVTLAPEIVKPRL